MSQIEALLIRRARLVPRAIPQIHPLAVKGGSGAILIDADGREILDFAAGIGVMSVGHGRAEVIDAISEQSRQLQHACFHVAVYEPYLALCERLSELLPHGEATKVMLVNSGAEAVENAIKIARAATGRSAVLCYTEAFHGRTLGALSLTSKTVSKVGCGPPASEVYRLPYPNRFRYGDGLSEEAFVQRELGRLRETFVHTVPAGQVAAIILEPLQGEGGVVPCPAAYLRGLRQLCDEHGIMLVCDEIQAGLCRSGRWASYEHAAITPDLSVWAKALGGGLPIGAVLGRAEVMDAPPPGTLGSTFGGNPICCAAALAVLEIMQREQLGDRATHMGELMCGRLAALRGALVADVRGLGAMVGIELCEQGEVSRPCKAVARAVVDACLARGLLLLTAGTHGNVIRLLPPLTTSDEQLERGLAILVEELERAAR